MGFSHISVMMAMTMLWSIKNFCSSSVLLLTLVTFHKILMFVYGCPFSSSLTICMVALILSKLLLQFT